MKSTQSMHMNELVYSAYKDMAGILWGMVIVLLFMLPVEKPFRLLILFVVGLVALLPLLWIVAKKMWLAQKASGALTRRSRVIVVDFLWKYVVFGTGMFLVRAAIEPDLLLSPSSEFNSIFFVFHVFMAIVLFVVMKIYASRERMVL